MTKTRAMISELTKLVVAICLVVVLVRWLIRKFLVERISPIAWLIEQMAGDGMQRRVSRSPDDRGVGDGLGSDRADAWRRWYGTRTRVSHRR